MLTSTVQQSDSSDDSASLYAESSVAPASPPYKSIMFPTSDRVISMPVRRANAPTSPAKLNDLPLKGPGSGSGSGSERQHLQQDAQVDLPTDAGLGYVSVQDSLTSASSGQLVQRTASRTHFVRNPSSTRVQLASGPSETGTSRSQDQSALEKEALELSAAEAYYLVKSLVGAELDYELGQLVLTLPGRTSPAQSLHELPLLSNLCNNYLFALPLLSDTGSSSDQLPVFFSHGLLPLVKALHGANLSHAVDVDSISLATVLGGYLQSSVESFYAAGLGLSTTAAVPSVAPTPSTPRPPSRTNGLPRPLITINASPVISTRTSSSRASTPTSTPRRPLVARKSSTGSAFREQLESDSESSYSVPESDGQVQDEDETDDSDLDYSSIADGTFTAEDMEREISQQRAERALGEKKDQERSASNGNGLVKVVIPFGHVNAPIASRQLPASPIFSPTSSSSPALSTSRGSPRVAAIASTDSSDGELSDADEEESASDVIAKSALSLPFGKSVPVWRSPKLESIAHGGFSADAVAVRLSLLSHSFIIRVRRPGKLDEYVIRSLEDFVKYGKVLDKSYPLAHFRPVPSDTNKDELLIAAPRPIRRSTFNGRSAFNSSVVTLTSQPSSGGEGLGLARRSTITNTPEVILPAHLVAPPVVIAKKVKPPPFDTHRRLLRNWLRDTLSVRGVGHHPETGTFLLLESFVPKSSDVKDALARQAIDNSRRSIRLQTAYLSGERAKTVYDAWENVQKDCIVGGGLSHISDALREHSTIAQLPEQYQLSLEYFRNHLAERLFEIFVASDNATELFSKFKVLHSLMPWFLIRQVFKLSNPETMITRLQSLFLAKPFGGQPIYTRILNTLLEDDEATIQSDLAALRTKIGCEIACKKIDRFVYSDRERKALVRQYARENNVELVFVICRGADEPRLAAWDLQRIATADKQSKLYLRTRPAARDKSNLNYHVALALDLKAYLRLVSRDKDARALRALLDDPTFHAALGSTVAPLVELVKRVYKSAPGAIGDLEKTLDQLVFILEAVRHRVQDQPKSIKAIAAVLKANEHGLYSLLHKSHTSDNLVEQILQVFGKAMKFLRESTPVPLALSTLLPPTMDERRAVMEELEDLVSYQRRRAFKQYTSVCRIYNGDVDADDPIVVEGDGAGKSAIHVVYSIQSTSPALFDIPKLVVNLRAQLKQIFAF